MKYFVLVVSFVMLFAVSAVSQEMDPELMEMCLADGNPEACCQCGYDVMRSTFTPEEFDAFMEALDLFDALEQAYNANNEAQINELSTRLGELEQILPQSRFDDLDMAIQTQCASVCPEEPAPAQ